MLILIKKLFTVSGDNIKANVVRLVLEGVDTVSFIEMNGSPIGSTNNMFVKYVFDVKQHIKVIDNYCIVLYQSYFVIYGVNVLSIQDVLLSFRVLINCSLYFNGYAEDNIFF